MATINLEAVEKSYGSHRVMESVTLDVNEGEFLVLVGPSGCGKSTLLRMIAGLEENTGGHIRIDGKIVDNLEPKDRDIAMVFQNYALYPHKSVEKNLSFALQLARLPKDEIARRVEKAAGILGLSELLQRRPGQLSGGQRQRVAMGRAIVRDPKVFLFDEPLSNLDAKLRVQMRSEIKSLHKSLGATIVYVTHDQIEAMTMADRIVVMNGGHIEQVGAPMELYDHPENMFVATFIGAPSMNLVNGTIERSGERLLLRTEKGAAFPLNVDMVPETKSGKLVVGFRPEHLQLAAPGENGAVEAKILTVEPTGTETFVQLSSGEEIFAATFHQRVDAHVGRVLLVKLDPEKLHFFDGVSGRKIV